MYTNMYIYTQSYTHTCMHSCTKHYMYRYTFTYIHKYTYVCTSKICIRKGNKKNIGHTAFDASNGVCVHVHYASAMQ